MDDTKFGQVLARLTELTHGEAALWGVQFVSFDESNHTVTIRVKDHSTKVYMRFRYSHEIMEAFDSVLDEKVLVSCTVDTSRYQEPHERFIS